MPKAKATRVSLSDVARAAKISKAAAGFALRNSPEVSKATRERVLRIAKRLGYAPDARVNSWMAQVRGARSKDLQPIAWLNNHSEKDAWQKYKFLSPYLEGAKERAQEYGYRIEEFWLRQPGMTMRRLSQILYQRGIEGIIVTHKHSHFQFKWDSLAGVLLEGANMAPRLHMVLTDTLFNFLLAIKMLNRFGYRRIGVCLSVGFERRTSHSIGAIARSLNSLAPKSVPISPLLYLGDSVEQWRTSKKQIKAWLHQHKPEVVIGHSSQLVECIEDAGFRVPQQIGVVHLAIDNDVPDWAGIVSNRKEIGKYAAEMVISLVQNRRFGVPETAMNTFIRGKWQPGWTLLIPKPK